MSSKKTWFVDCDPAKLASLQTNHMLFNTWFKILVSLSLTFDKSQAMAS